MNSIVYIIVIYKLKVFCDENLVKERNYIKFDFDQINSEDSNWGQFEISKNHRIIELLIT